MELQLLNEKHVLEKRYAGLRLELDQHQNEIIAAASRALSHRKSELEENMNLAQKLLTAEQERSIFLSSLLGLLADNDLQPVVVNASTIVRNIQVLLQNLRGKLEASSGGEDLSRTPIINHQKSPEFDLQPLAGLSNYDPQFPPNSPAFSFYPHQLYQCDYPSVSAAPSVAKFIPVTDGRGGTMPLISSMQNLTLGANTIDTSTSRMKGNEYPNAAMPSEARIGMTSVYSDEFTFRSQNMFVKHLEDQRPDIIDQSIAPVSEGQLLPGVDDLQIYGEARLGCMIQACGHLANGATVCMFQWVYLEDHQYIDVEGATYPDYLVTADDVDRIIAVHCIPVDAYGHQGELVMAFANDGQKISLDPDVRQEIETHLSSGKAIFDVLLLKEPSEVWEQVRLVLDRFGFKVNSSNPAYAIDEDYPTFGLAIIIPFLDRTQCILRSSNGNYQLKNDLRSRDILVITMKCFQRQALERKRIT